jgi:hypothetical protein
MENPDENTRRISRISQKIDGQEARILNHEITTLTYVFYPHVESSLIQKF